MVRRGAALLALAIGLSACGSHPAAPIVAPPVPETSVPPRVDASGGLAVVPNRTSEIGQAFRSVGKTSLVTDGKVWEVRQGDRLVGLLELASLRARADTRKEADRRAIRQQILPGEPAELDFGGVPVYQTSDGTRSVYLWFGRQVFGALQLKGKIDPDAVANELIGKILQDQRWPGLPPDDFQDL